MWIVRALGLALLAGVLGAGCGSGRHAPSGMPACVLSARQRHAVTVAERDIRRLHRLQSRVRHYSRAGTPALQRQTNRVLLDIGRVPLPIDTRGRLLRQAKAAAGLCGSCFDAFESAEPVATSRLGGPECGD